MNWLQAHGGQEPEKSQQLYYRISENGPELLKEVLEARGWEPFEGEKTPYWNLWWKGSRYSTKDYQQCEPWQRINHFPKTALMTRKVSM